MSRYFFFAAPAVALGGRRGPRRFRPLEPGERPAAFALTAFLVRGSCDARASAASWVFCAAWASVALSASALASVRVLFSAEVSVWAGVSVLARASVRVRVAGAEASGPRWAAVPVAV